jgi:prepilin-type N-terminal cleavage/methylation domain-containing protein
MKNRSTKNRRRDRGFSLVELVIVIIIIGIIAAIAVPRVSRGSKGAAESALTSNLSILRNSLELYASEHEGKYPGQTGDGTNAQETPAAVVNQLLKYSGVDGTVADTRSATTPYGPYLRKGIPPVPVGTNQGSTGIAIDTTNSPPAVVGTAGIGWVYNPNTGDIIANSDATNEAGDTTYDTY